MNTPTLPLPRLPHAPQLKHGIHKCGLRDELRTKWWIETEKMVNAAVDRFWNNRAQQGVYRPTRENES